MLRVPALREVEMLVLRDYLETVPKLAQITRDLKAFCGPVIRTEVLGVLWIELSPDHYLKMWPYLEAGFLRV